MTPLLSSGLLRAQTDDRLVELAAAGHDRAFEAIVERYRRPLLRYLRRLLSDTLAEDVVQATFINAWSSLRTGTEVRDLRPWLYRIAHNAAINALKKVGEAMEEVPESIGGFATEPAAELERRDEMHRALTSIAALPSRQRAALLAVAVDGRAHSDVAAELGLTDGAVRQLVHRARRTLRTGATAITPLPLLHALMASAGDSTVARVAEVAAGAGGAGAASLSLKAGAAAVLATGALVTGGPHVAHVVHPSQRATQPTAHVPAPASTSGTAGGNRAAKPLAAAAIAQNRPASTSAASGRSPKQRHSGRDAGKGGASSAKHQRGSGSKHGGRGSGRTQTTSGRHQGSTSSGHDGGGGSASRGSDSGGGGGGGGRGAGEQETASSKHDAASGKQETASGKQETASGKQETASRKQETASRKQAAATAGHDVAKGQRAHGAKKRSGGKKGGRHAGVTVVKPPTTTAKPDGDGGGGDADAPTQTTPTVTSAPAPASAPPDASGGGHVRTESGGDSGRE